MKLYSIGQVSSILGMPVKTIRYYDEIGLCSPSMVDRYSGYRRYSVDDIITLDTIRCLGRELGMPLRSIGEFLENHNDPRILKEYLRQQEHEIDAEIEKLLERRALINEKLDVIIRTEMTKLLTPARVDLPERTIYTADQSAGSIEEGLFMIRRLAGSSEKVDKYKLYLLKNGLEEGGAHFTWEEYKAGTDVPFSQPEPVVLTLPGGSYAVINYRNDRENRAQAFQLFK